MPRLCIHINTHVHPYIHIEYAYETFFFKQLKTYVHTQCYLPLDGICEVTDMKAIIVLKEGPIPPSEPAESVTSPSHVLMMAAPLNEYSRYVHTP